MFDQLQSVKNRYEEIVRQIQDPSVISDTVLYPALMKEYKNLTPIVAAFEQYSKADSTYKEARELLEQGGLEPEFRELLQAEWEENKEAAERAANELKILLLPKDENDEKSVIVEIRGGAGGEEAALFAASLYRMYQLYADSRGWKTEILNANETELGGFKEVDFSVEGEGVYSRLKYESGVHRVQRVPDTETQGRVHTSTVTVAVMPEAQEVEFELDPADLKIDVFRSSGAGGQKVNKTSSAIRITYLPTGLVVECQDERSQYKNKDKAMKILRSRLYNQKLEEQNSRIAAQRKSQVGTGDRSERIRTYNFPQSRLTDHRIGLTLYRLDDVMNGVLDPVIEPLITADQAAKLQSAEEA